MAKINYRAYYKLDVDQALRVQTEPVILPRGKHPLWTVIEQCYYQDMPVLECVQLVIKLHGEEHNG